MDKHRSIEKIIENLDTKKYTVPEDWPYQQARRLFKTPDVTDPETIDVNILSTLGLGFHDRYKTKLYINLVKKTNTKEESSVFGHIQTFSCSNIFPFLS